MMAAGALAGSVIYFFGHPQVPIEFSSSFNAEEDLGPSLPHIAVIRFDSSANGQSLLCVLRGGEDTEGRLALSCPNSRMGWTPIDVMAEPVGAAALALDGGHALVGTRHGQLAWIDLESREIVPLLESSNAGGITAVAGSADGKMFAAGDWYGRIYLCHPPGRESRILVGNGPGGIYDLRFSCDAQRLASAKSDGSVCIWDVATASLLHQLRGHDGPATGAEILPDGNRAISAGLDGTIRIWEIGSGREQWRKECNSYGITALAVAPDGRTAAWGSLSRQITVWNLEQGRIEFVIDTPAAIFHLRFSPNGKTLTAAGNEASIRRYDASTGVEEDELVIRLDR
jgi:hypothetical protein